MLEFILGALGVVFSSTSPLLYIFIGLMLFSTFQLIRRAFIV